MAETRTIPLEGKIPKNGSIEFLSAQISIKYYFPLALIHYSVKGHKSELGLRLDLDKRAFLDHPFEEVPLGSEEERQNRIVDEAAPKIVEYLGLVLFQSGKLEGKS